MGGSTTTASTSTTTTISTTSTTESLGGMCTAYSQCGGQNWSGCTVCPGRQVCKLNGKDPWTKVCVDPLAELSGDPSSTDAAIIVCSGGQVFLFLPLSLSLSLFLILSIIQIPRLRSLLASQASNASPSHCQHRTWQNCAAA